MDMAWKAWAVVAGSAMVVGSAFFLSACVDAGPEAEQEEEAETTGGDESGEPVDEDDEDDEDDEAFPPDAGGGRADAPPVPGSVVSTGAWSNTGPIRVQGTYSGGGGSNLVSDVSTGNQ
jgi:hypothetical protein